MMFRDLFFPVVALRLARARAETQPGAVTVVVGGNVRSCSNIFSAARFFESLNHEQMIHNTYLNSLTCFSTEWNRNHVLIPSLILILLYDQLIVVIFKKVFLTFFPLPSPVVSNLSPTQHRVTKVFICGCPFSETTSKTTGKFLFNAISCTREMGLLSSDSGSATPQAAKYI